MILVHEKGFTDPNGVQRTIMAYMARQKNHRAGQPEITAHVLAECQAHAISHLEALNNSGAITTLPDNPTMFRLTEEGREWCAEHGMIRTRKPAQDATDEEDTQDAAEPAAPGPAKRGRPRRQAPAPE